MKMHDKKVMKIVRAKAEFLISCQGDTVNFSVATSRLARMEIDINAMPERGIRQREQKAAAWRDLDRSIDLLNQRVGASVMRTYSFVATHSLMLSPGQRKMLLGGQK